MVLMESTARISASTTRRTAMTVLATSHPKSVAAPDVSAFIFLMNLLRPRLKRSFGEFLIAMYPMMKFR